MNPHDPSALSPRAGRATVLLIMVTAAWGSSFFLIRDVVATVPAADFLAVRFSLATLVMWALLHRRVGALTAGQVRAGIGLGGVYGLAQLLQTAGLEHTSATRSGFITGMYVVITPALGALVLRSRLPVATWVAALGALAGLGVLSLGSIGWGLGETLTLASAAIFAVHILWLGAASEEGATLGLAAVQIAACTVVCAIAAVAGGVVTPGTAFDWAVLIYLALVCGAAAMWAQTWAQAHLAPTRAAIVMTTEPVFAALFAVGVGGELMTSRVAVGGGLILAAMYLSELGPRTRTATVPVEGLHHEPGG
ncbi:MAG: DMT family transporter [Dermatophilaceae bacterium]